MYTSSTTDSEDDIEIKKFLEAADPTFLTNDMFKPQPPSEQAEINILDETKNNVNTYSTIPPYLEKIPSKTTNVPKSQRYLDGDESIGADIDLPDTARNHIYKKLAEIINRNIDFGDLEPCWNPRKRKEPKSKLKLLAGADCYVKSYEEFEYETSPGMRERIPIKRRQIDKEEKPINESERLKLVSVDAKDILEGAEVKNWAQKPDRKGKVFHYKMGFTGMLHAKDVENEFSKLRRKNKWNETKIKERKK